MNLTIPLPDEGSPTEGDEITWRRELKQLRVRVVQLEAERGLRQAPSIDVRRSEVHSLRCGMPPAVTVVENEQRVECAACGTELSAIEVLHEYAKHERNFCYSLEHLRKERRDLHVEIDKLKALRARLRAEARKALPAVPSRPGARKWDQDQVANHQLDQVLAREPSPSDKSTR